MTNCRICGSEDTEEIIDWKEYKIMKCSRCALRFVEPLPSDEELNHFYQGFMFKKPEESEIAKKLAKKTKDLKKLFDLSESKVIQNRKFLDFGGGTGIGYKAALDLGLESYYQDIDETAKSFSKKAFGLSSEFIIEKIEKSNIKFKFIFSDNVIEHVKDPLLFVRILSNQLDNGGSLVIKTPHGGNSEAFFNPYISVKGYFFSALKYNSIKKSIRAYFLRFWHCDPPRHLYSFSEKSFYYLSEQLKIDGINHEVFFYDIPWFSNTLTENFFLRKMKSVTMKSILIRFLLLPIIPIEALLQLLKFILVKLKILSKGGIILKITKGVN